MSESAAIATQYAIRDEQIAVFDRQGWIVLRQVFSAEERAHTLPVLRSYVEGVKARAEGKDANPFGSPNTPEVLDAAQTYQEGDRAVKAAYNLEAAPTEAAQIIKSRRLGEIAARMLGVKAVRVMHFSGLFKPPGSAGTPLHQDLNFLPLDTDRSLTIWIPLTDIETNMGPLIFATGSHTGGKIEDQVGARERFPFLHTGPMKAGDVSLHMGWTIHGSLKNSSSRSREAFGISYFADGARIRTADGAKFRHTLKDSCFAGLNPGDMAAGPSNPVVFPVEAV